MKSIEERAYKKSLEMFKPKANVTTKELLIEMATEQAEITKQEMLEKAKQFLLSNQGNLNYIDEEGNLYSDGFIVDLIKHLE